MSSPIRTRFAALCATLLAVVALVALPATAASAHDQVVRQFPTAGQHLDTAPTAVSLVFTAPPLDTGAVLMVVDAEGTDWVDGDPVLTESEVSQPLAGALPDGNYQVRWRVVSSDGHPISESFLFSVGDVSGAAPIPVPESGGEPASEIDDATAAGDFALGDAVEASSAASTSGSNLWLVALGGAAVGVLLFATGGLVAGFSRRASPASAPAAAADTPTNGLEHDS